MKRLASLAAVVVATLTLAAGPAAAQAQPAFSGTARPIPADVRQWMTGRSWHPGCPVSLGRLALVSVTYWGFDQRARRGTLVVAANQATKVITAFGRLYQARFPIQRMTLVDAYGGSDARSMAANNTSAFNCRRVTGGTRWSEHSYGTAIDVNPVQNPYVRGRVVEPAAGRAYVDRRRVRPGMIAPGSGARAAFVGVGWRWGGDWRSLKDYQHFSATGR